MRQFMFVMMMAVVFSMFGCQKYDSLVEFDQVAQQKWSDYEAQLQRRGDMIPNLVKIVQAGAHHEQATLTAVTEARASATQIRLTGEDLTDPAKVAAFQKAQSQLKGSLSRLMVASENYPELKGMQGFKDLQIQLEGTENRILRSREEYNKSVKNFNSELGKVRGAVVNNATGHPFKARVYFTADPGSTAVPKVDFAASSPATSAK